MSLRSTFKELGALDGALYLFGRLLEKASGARVRIVKYYLVAQPIGRPGSKPMRPDAATTLRPVAEGDPVLAQVARPAHIIAQRYAAGATCTAAWVRDDFAGFIWIQRGRYVEDEVRCLYVLQDPATCVWDFDVYVEPKYRIGRTMSRLWSHVDAELAATGVRWSCSRISAFNAASLASHARLGLVRQGSVLFLVAGPAQLTLLPGFPYLHLGFSERSAPVLRLAPPPQS